MTSTDGKCVDGTTFQIPWWDRRQILENSIHFPTYKLVTIILSIYSINKYMSIHYIQDTNYPNPLILAPNRRRRVFLIFVSVHFSDDLCSSSVVPLSPVRPANAQRIVALWKDSKAFETCQNSMNAMSLSGVAVADRAGTGSPCSMETCSAAAVAADCCCYYCY